MRATTASLIKHRIKKAVLSIEQIDRSIANTHRALVLDMIGFQQISSQGVSTSAQGLNLAKPWCTFPSCVMDGRMRIAIIFQGQLTFPRTVINISLSLTYVCLPT